MSGLYDKNCQSRTDKSKPSIVSFLELFHNISRKFSKIIIIGKTIPKSEGHFMELKLYIPEVQSVPNWAIIFDGSRPSQNIMRKSP